VTCTHGRDARDPFTGRPDPKWGKIALPKLRPADLATDPDGGVLDPGSDPPAQSSPDPGGGGDTAPSSGSETNGEQGNGEATDARGVHASKAVTQRLTLWTHGGSRVWICKWMLPQLEYALESGGWDGRINEGWRSRATEELYWDKHGHDPGLAAPPGHLATTA
jgi:hypothetical protein